LQNGRQASIWYSEKNQSISHELFSSMSFLCIHQRGDSDDDDDINNSASGTEEDVIFSASTGRQPFRFQSDDVDHSEHQNVFTQNKPSWLPSESATDFDFSSQNSLQFEWTDATITADPVDDEFEHEDK
jgi:hypothetical protein